MSKITVNDLSKIVGVEPRSLLEQLNLAGITKKSENDVVTDEEKNALLSFIKGSPTQSKTITLKRKTTQQLKASGSRKVNVEVRKKRSMVNQNQIDTAKLAAEAKAKAEAKAAAEAKAKAEAKAAAEAKAEAEAKAAAEAKAETEAKAKEENKDNSDKGTAAPAQPLFGGNISQAEKLKEERKAELSLKKKADISKLSDEAQQEKTKKNTFSKNEKTPIIKTESTNEEENEMDLLNKNKKTKKPKGRKKRSSQEFIDAALDADNLDNDKGNKGKLKKRVNLKKVTTQSFNKPSAPIMKSVDIPENITVADLAQRMSIKAAALIKSLMKMGVMATINHNLDQETAVLLVEELGYSYTTIKDNAIEDEVAVEHSNEKIASRAPVITIMGHVDHGKTSLLDYIRNANVTKSEAGGITQHIGAYSVETSRGSLTFLDTPGHEAFTAMRARGANATDIIILVVAADDGVMPQTIEAIQHAKAANVPIIVAVNKMDKDTADPDRVKNELSQQDVIPEDWGGEVMFAPVSAKTGDGVEDLLEGVALHAEMLELKAPITGYAEGVVVESKMHKGKGAVATILIKNGMLKQGDTILAGIEVGRIRAMVNDKGESIKEAGPSIPVEVLGLSGVPNAGDEVVAVKDEKVAREVAEFRNEKQKSEKLQQQQTAKLTNLFSRVGDEEEQQVLNIILKTDVQGSLEALRDSLTKLSTDDIRLEIISSGIGGINSSDVTLASASQAVLFGFNVRADLTSKKQAENDNLEIRYYSVIYDLINDVKSAMSGMLSPELRENIIGTAEVRDVFRSSRYGSIAGCMVIDGLIKRNNPIRVLRDQVVIYEGSLESLKRFKEDAMEVKKDTECGIGVKNYNDVKVGDQIEVFEIIEVAREI